MDAGDYLRSSLRQQARSPRPSTAWTAGAGEIRRLHASLEQAREQGDREEWNATAAPFMRLLVYLYPAENLGWFEHRAHDEAKRIDAQVRAQVDWWGNIAFEDKVKAAYAVYRTLWKTAPEDPRRTSLEHARRITRACRDYHHAAHGPWDLSSYGFADSSDDRVDRAVEHVVLGLLGDGTPWLSHAQRKMLAMDHAHLGPDVNARAQELRTAGEPAPFPEHQPETCPLCGSPDAAVIDTAGALFCAACSAYLATWVPRRPASAPRLDETVHSLAADDLLSTTGSLDTVDERPSEEIEPPEAEAPLPDPGPAEPPVAAIEPPLPPPVAAEPPTEDSLEPDAFAHGLEVSGESISLDSLTDELLEPAVEELPPEPPEAAPSPARALPEDLPEPSSLEIPPGPPPVEAEEPKEPEPPAAEKEEPSAPEPPASEQEESSPPDSEEVFQVFDDDEPSIEAADGKKKGLLGRFFGKKK